MIDLSVVIVNWNTEELLAGCLGSIFRNTGALHIEVVVVDNASADGSTAMVHQQFPDVILIENKHNVGFAKANNQALRTLKGRYYLLLNSDTIVLQGTLEGLVKWVDARQQKVGIIGPELLNRDGSIQESWARFPTFWSEITGKNQRVRNLIDEETRAYTVDWVGGACMLINPEALAEVGLFDERYSMYSEETDLCYRMWQHGWPVIYMARYGVIHFGGASANRMSARQLVTLYKSKIQFFQKHFGKSQAVILRIGLICKNLLSLLLTSLAWIFGARQAIKESNNITARWTLIRWLLNPGWVHANWSIESS